MFTKINSEKLSGQNLPTFGQRFRLLHCGAAEHAFSTAKQLMGIDEPFKLVNQLHLTEIWFLSSNNWPILFQTHGKRT